MSVSPHLAALTGTWSGTNRLHLPWLPVPIVESESTCTVRTRANGQCLEIEYQWSYEDKPQEGFLVINGPREGSSAHAFWTDSWHSANVLMACTGSVDENGNVSVTGHYSVPEHPDWGWRTEIRPGTDGFEYRMYNISPEGVEEIAVETVFSRA